MHRRCVPQMQALRWLQRRCNSNSSRSSSSTTTTATSSSSSRSTDPFAPVATPLAALRATLPPLLSAGHPAITEATQYYFQHPSKQVRPLIVLLMARATNGLGGRWEEKVRWAEGLVQTGESAGKDKERDWDMGALDVPLTRPDVLNDWNPEQLRETARFNATFDLLPPGGDARRHRVSTSPSLSSLTTTSTPSETSSQPTSRTLSPVLLSTQLRLAQIVEMMHTASLLHDDVIDASALRRGAPSAPAAFGNKRAVLGGNFILGRASVALARLGDGEVTELIASVLSNLVEGEILQLKDVKIGGENAGSGEVKVSKGRVTLPTPPPVESRNKMAQEAWNIYLQKTYLKTASLMAKGARSSVVLGGCQEGEVWKEAAYAYGRNLGIAFQLVDDVLDYESASAALGKPGGADLSLGLATGPALYAWEEHPEMGALIARKFANEGDVEMARDLVHRSSGVQRTRTLAQAYADAAVEVLQVFPPSEARDALEALAGLVMKRKS